MGNHDNTVVNFLMFVWKVDAEHYIFMNIWLSAQNPRRNCNDFVGHRFRFKHPKQHQFTDFAPFSHV